MAIARRCINCGASESQSIKMVTRRFEGLIVYVCQDIGACAQRFKVVQDEQPALDWTAVQHKPGF